MPRSRRTRVSGSGAAATACAPRAPFFPFPARRISLALWFLKPLALVRKRWKGKNVRLACQSYVEGPVEVVGVLGKTGRKAQQAYGLE